MIRVQVAAPGAASSDLPSVAMSPAGDFVVAWRAAFPSPPPAPSGWLDRHVFARRFNRHGAAGPTVRVNSEGTEAQPGPTGPAVAMDADGDFVVAWKSYLAEPLYARRFDADSAGADALFCDLDADGRVDARDVMVVRRHLGRVLAEAAGSVGSARLRADRYSATGYFAG